MVDPLRGPAFARRRPLPPVVAQASDAGQEPMHGLGGPAARRHSAPVPSGRPTHARQPSARHRSVRKVPGLDGRGVDARAGGRQRDDAGDRDAGRQALGAHRPAEGRDARGFVFYTNTQSRKGEELAANRGPRCCSTGSRWAARSASRAASSRDRGRGGRLFRDPRADFPARRLGVRPVPPAAGARRAGTAAGGVRGEVSRRRHSAPAALVGLPRAAGRDSSSGRTCRSGCTTALSMQARPTAAGPSASCSPDPSMTCRPNRPRRWRFC